MRPKMSPWIFGAILSSVALLSHGSGAVNFDGLNPLLVAGCAHQPGSRLMVRNAGDEKRSITLKANHRIQLRLRDGSTVEGRFVGKINETARATAPKGMLFIPVPAHPSSGRSLTLQLEDGSVQQVRIAQIRGIGFNRPRDGWKYLRVGAFIGAIPAAFAGILLAELAGVTRSGERLGVVALCAPFGAVPGAALGG